MGVFMKPTAFRIRNYKSIKDTGKIYFDPKITVLAGKNEAGKTAILEALEDFNFNNNINPKAIPINDESQKPEITLWFKCNDQDVSFLENLYKNKITLSYFMITKSYPKDYLMRSNLKLAEGTTKDLLVEKINYFKLKGIKFPIDVVNGELFESINNLEKYRSHFNDYLSELNLTLSPPEIQNSTNQFHLLLNTLSQNNSIIKSILDNLIPNIILFSSFDDKIPDKTPIGSVNGAPIIKDLITLAEIDVALIQPTADPRKKEMHRRSVNLEFSKDYGQFWNQDDSKLSITWDNQFFYLWIEEEKVLFEPERRSKGRQWHLAFYIRITARTRDEKMNLILVDEPGLFLHAKAQKDILSKLEDCSKTSPIVYSTHSPYLISTNHLERIRLVIKNDSFETEIKKFTEDADKETITPILTAIGEDYSSGIKMDKANSVVVEGFSDYLWLKSLHTLLGLNNNINIIPSVGAGSVIHVGCILFGWSLNPFFILDNDMEGRKTKIKLIKELCIQEENIFLVPDEEGTIEKMFSPNDYKKYADFKNSEYSKVILATKFYDSIKKGEISKSNLTDETIDSFRNLFEEINQAKKKQNEF